MTKEEVYLSQAAPLVKEMLDASKKIAVREVHTLVQGGLLTPEMALAMWMKYLAYEEIEQRMRVLQRKEAFLNNEAVKRLAEGAE